MGSDLNITKELQEYILSHGFNLHPVQKEIIDYNTSLGDIKRMHSFDITKRSVVINYFLLDRM